MSHPNNPFDFFKFATGSKQLQPPNTRRQRRHALRIEMLEDRRVLDGDSHGPAGVDVPFGVYTEAEIKALEAVPFNSNLSTKTDPVPGTSDLNSVTFVLDFKGAGQANTSDIFGNVISTFDVTSYGFSAGDFNTVVNSIMSEVNQDYFSELVGTVAGQNGEALDVNFILGDIGTAPVGYTEYYYVQIGTVVSGPHTGSLGVAGGSVVRNAAGAGPNFGIQVGDVVGSIFTNNIQGLGGLSPSNALTSGNLQFTTFAISGTTAHEIGHTLSLSHINKAGSVQPTASAAPLMGTGAIDLPNQDRITDREFSLSGFDGENGNNLRQHIQQLVNAVGLTGSDDHGNSPGSATSIAVPSVTAGNIETSNDEDFFAFTARTNGVYTLSTTLGTNTDTTLTLYDTDGTTVLGFDDDGGDGLASLLQWTAPANGTYFMRVRSFGAGTGTYALNTTVLDDHGNSAAEATPVAIPSVTEGNIESSGDVDFFRFDASVGGAYQFSTTLNTNPDTTLALYDVDGVTELAFDDDGGPGAASLISWTAPATGAYFLAVRGFANAVGSYSLTALAVDDHGNASDLATTISVPSTTNGNIETANDEDYFRFPATPGASYTFATSLGTNQDTTLTLYDIDGTTVLAFDDDGGNGLASLINWTAPAAGTYYLKVRSFSTTGTGTYALNTSVSDDHGNSHVAATAVSIPSATAGNIEYGNDVDYVSFFAFANVTYEFATELGTNVDTTVTLFDTDGVTAIGYDDDGGPGLASLLRWVAPADGTYYAMVRSFSTTGIGTYTFSAAVVDDHANTFDLATPIAIPSTTPGNVEVSEDLDFFSFSAASGVAYSISTNLLTNSDTTLTLYDTDGATVLAFDDDGGPGLASLIEWNSPASGTYYLQVRSFGLGTGTYFLDLQNSTDTTPPDAPTMLLDNDTGIVGDMITSIGSYTVVPAEPNGTMEYSIDGGVWSTVAPTAVEGLNTMFARQTDAAGNVGAVASMTFTLDTIAATVTNMYITSTLWATTFIDAVDGGGLGAGNGVGIPFATGMQPVPSAGINRMVLQFSEDVQSVVPAIEVRDSSGVLPVTVSYDSNTLRATIALANGLFFHKIRVAILDSVVDIAGNQLDGDNAGGAGGIFNSRFDVLAGDFSGDGRVNGVDLSAFGSGFNSQVGQANYNPRLDWNGDGRVNGADLSIFGTAFNRSLQNLTEPGSPFSDNGQGGAGFFSDPADDYFGGLGDDEDDDNGLLGAM